MNCKRHGESPATTQGRCRTCSRESVRRYDQEHREERRLKAEQRRQANPRHTRAIAHLFWFGLTREEVDAIFVRQGGKCPICLEALDALDVPDCRTVLDHCHTTGKVRGLLHKGCNT